MKPEQKYLILLLVFVLGWPQFAYSLKFQSQKCDASPMTLPQSVLNIVKTDLRDAQNLSRKDKAKLGYDLLVSSVEQGALTRAYVDYFVAQMYVNYPDQNQYREVLLSSAVKSQQLYGAELQDALFSLANLYQKSGDLKSYETYLGQWQQVVCAPKFAEATEPNKAIADKSRLTPLVDKPVTVPARPPMPVKVETKVPSALTTATGKQILTQKKQSKPLVDGSELAPKLLKYIEPLYPPDAYDKDISGYVSLSFTITKDGFVTDVEVLKSVPENVFEHAAVNAVKQWLFRPKMNKGKAQTKFGHRIRLNFDIKQAQ